MATWKTRTCIETCPKRVLELLTDPDACERWAPVPFELEDLEDPRLAAGTRVRLAGRIAGKTVAFDVQIEEADDRRLALRATGPFEIAARYEAVPRGKRTELRAAVSVEGGGGLAGRLMSRAADALLAAGALDSTMSRIAREAESRVREARTPSELALAA
jgi:carbon monoxide dehydrogenase subunit G